MDREILSLENLLHQIETLTTEKQNLAQQNIHLQTSEEELQGALLKDKQAISLWDTKIADMQIDRLRGLEASTIHRKELMRDMEVLISEFKNVQLESKQLQEEESMLGELYAIFAKELLLLVLQDSLPVLNDIINNYLSQVVDYQVLLELKMINDKPELKVNVMDAKGEREIKSLSGGQMVILKLVWMLSISSYIHSPILFLDETINNLDGETVGKVADLLEDFVQQRQMKLYTVTHSQQIQDMDIWDEIIELEGIR